VIAFDGADRARGQWALTFHNINLAHRTITQFGIEYDDVYVRDGACWRIAETASRRKSVLVQAIDAEGNARVIALGESDAAFGEG
jgi:hypothetical protein